MVSRVLRAMNCCLVNALRPDPLPFESDVFPWISVASGDGRKHVLPFLRVDARTYCVQEGVAEYGDEIVVLQNGTLHLLRQLLAIRRIGRRVVVVELGIQLLDANAVGCVEAAAFEESLVPVGPCPTDAS